MVSEPLVASRFSSDVGKRERERERESFPSCCTLQAVQGCEQVLAAESFHALVFYTEPMRQI